MWPALLQSKPPWVRGPSLQAVLNAFPSLTLSLEGNASGKNPSHTAAASDSSLSWTFDR
jgi:hypothetical protein